VSILVDQDTRVVVQGTRNQGTIHAKRNKAYGTNVVAGVHPKKGGTTWEELGVPIYRTAGEAVEAEGANTSMIMVPAPFAKDALVEALEGGVDTIVCITEGIPVHDMSLVYNTIYPRSADGTFDKVGRPVLIGPNCPGLISPGRANVGIIPHEITMEGSVGLVSRSGTLTYQALYELKLNDISVSTCVGIGGDPVRGMNFIDVIALFEKDADTQGIIMVGEIGGTDEEAAAEFIKSNVTKPVVAYIAGVTAPPGKRMGHAGAIISGGKGTADEKFKALEAAGVRTVRSPAELGEAIHAAVAG
jgi:succinyl-CoA synthetase alpha subunit